MIKEGTLVWKLNVVSSTARDWTADEITLIKEVAERTWAAVERAKAGAALRASDERFREFAAASTDILWIRNAHTMQFEFVSSAFTKVYGAPLEEVIGGNDLKRWARLIAPEDRRRVFEAFRLLQRGEWVVHEFRIIRPSDGQVRWIRDTAFSGKQQYRGSHRGYQAELSAHGATPGSVFFEGPSGVRLRSSTVQTLALALHELATNAVKYGAISTPAGRLHVGWHVTGNGDTNQILNVDWRETGVNIDAASMAVQHYEYGRELIERALPYQREDPI